MQTSEVLSWVRFEFHAFIEKGGKQ